MLKALPVGVAVVGVLLLQGMVLADCPSACSGHGICQNWRDFCECYDGWQGNDCAQRTCAFGLSWIDTPNGDLDCDNLYVSGFGDQVAAYGSRPIGVARYTALNPQYRPNGWWERHPSQLYGTSGDNRANLPLYVRTEEGHFYAECSNRGICDRSVGECACFTGYGGAACNRTVCANDCSGHGVCKSMRQAAPASATYNLYDMDKSYGCVCDAEYFGSDCSLRRCFRNDDPLTVSTTRRGHSEKLSEQEEEQHILVGCAHGGVVKSGSTMRVVYTDVQFGEKYTTGQFDPSSPFGAAELEALLRALPNGVLASSSGVDRVSVNRIKYADTITGASTYRYMITFHRSLGDVPMMSVISDVKCTAGFEFPANYKSNAWKDTLQTKLIGDGPTEDTLVTFKVETDSASGTADAYSYKVETAGATAASYAGPINFPAANTWVSVNGVAATLNADNEPVAGVSSLTNVLKAAFQFTLPADDGASGGALRPAGATYSVQFRAPAPVVSVYTPLFNMSTTLPITYKVMSGAKAVLVEYVTQFTPPSTATVDYMDISFPAGVTTQFDLQVTSNGATALSETGITINAAVTHASFMTTYRNGWIYLSDKNSVTSLQYERVRLKFPDTYAGGESWRVHLNPGTISSGGAATSEVVTLSWLQDAKPTFPYNRADVAITISNVAATPDRYQWTLNGVNMGEYDVPASASTLGGSSNIASVAVSFAAGAHSANRAVGQSWHFSLVRTPIQSAWAYHEVLRVEYADSTTQPSKNLGIAIQLTSIDSDQDQFKWKLTTDDDYETGDWDTQQDPAVLWSSLYSPFPTVPSPLGDYADHPFEAEELAKLWFSFSGGADSNQRSCAENSVNSNYYVQLGLEGINDFVVCSDRGVCDETTGQCKCFKGYYGEDCHEQHALYV